MIRGRARTRELFPVSLYASLLVAMVCLVRPEPARTVQRACASVAALPLRAWNVLAPRSAEAATTADEVARAHGLREILESRVARALGGRPAGVPSTLVPTVAVVVDRRHPGAGDAPTELVLGVPRDALAEYVAFVTAGDALVGFLGDEPVAAVDTRSNAVDPMAGLARVELLHRAPPADTPRRVPAAVVAPRGGTLRFLVAPATTIDRWPLRCELLDDPYLAASLDEVDLPVRTTGFADDPFGALPEGLRIGDLRLFGYRVDGGRRVVPIGLFVEPARPAESLHHVVLWSRPEARARIPATQPPRGARVPVQLARLPVPGVEGERLFATSADRVARPLTEGGAVLSGERLLGVLDTGGFGFGVVSPFGVPGRAWPVTLVPDDESRVPLELVAVARWREQDTVELELPFGRTAEAASGHLFTAADGPGVPAGVWIGPARLDSVGRLLVQHVPPDRLVGGAVVCDVRRTAEER